MIAGFQSSIRTSTLTLSIGNRQETGEALRGYDLDFAIMAASPPTST